MSDDKNLITVEMVGIKNEREELLIKLWWNAAIEAAAKLVHDEMGEPDDTFWIVEKVRKLKK